MILVTGGAGFIGAHFVREWLEATGEAVVNLDGLTYAAQPEALAPLAADSRHVFVAGDVGDTALLRRIFETYQPRAVVHFAAQTHVDRSIEAPTPFLETNVVGSFRLLEVARDYWQCLDAASRADFRFVQVSTDEVFGEQPQGAPPCSAGSAYAPGNPYAASKAAADHLARAWHRSYGFPAIVTCCSNNYGPWQWPEKLVPLTLTRALAGETIPLYGDGTQTRDWLYVSDHCAALRRVLERGEPGRTYLVSAHCEVENRALVEAICDRLDHRYPDPAGSYRRLIRHVADRPGHDRRYALDATETRAALDWAPVVSLEDGLDRTVDWYVRRLASRSRPGVPGCA